MGASIGGVRLRRPARSFDLHQYLTVLFVCAVSTVILTRAFLAATGYPQVGGSKFHIAHVLYGGLLLLTAVLLTLAFLSPETKYIASIVGGIGFGLFIDEVGKFVTKDVNYFYKPAIAIIYVVFCGLFGVIRWLSRRNYRAGEATLIGLDALQRASVGALSEQRRTRVLALMHDKDDGTKLAHSVRQLLTHTAAEAEVPPSLAHRVSHALERAWVPLTEHRLFRTSVFATLAVAALISAAEVGWLLRHGLHHLAFSQKAFTLTTIAADLLLLVGALRLRRSLLSALHWYDHAVLLEITVAQIFLYDSEQIAATANLFALLIVWSLIRWAIHFELARPQT